MRLFSRRLLPALATALCFSASCATVAAAASERGEGSAEQRVIDPALLATPDRQQPSAEEVHEAANAAKQQAEKPDEPASEHGQGAETHEAHPPKPLSRRPQPYEIVRSLQFLQDQVARGNSNAIRVQSLLLRRYGATFEAAPPETWDDPRNMRAAALFVLSGGPPATLKAVIQKLPADMTQSPLLRGALAYVEQRAPDAIKLLGSIDATELEPVLGAQINLALAQMLQTAEPEEALTRIAQVILAAPGTLLEESALRLGVLVAEGQGRHDTADIYARRYFSAFPNSSYGGNFRARFAAVYAERPLGTEDKTIALIRSATEPIAANDRLAILLAVGRRALVRGNLKLAALAAEAALDLDAGEPADRQRAELYLAASTISEKNLPAIKAQLVAIDAELLHPADRKLHDAALGVINRIKRPLQRGDALIAAASEEIESSTVMKRGENLLDALSTDLNEAVQ